MIMVSNRPSSHSMITDRNVAHLYLIQTAIDVVTPVASGIWASTWSRLPIGKLHIQQSVSSLHVDVIPNGIRLHNNDMDD